MPAVRSLAVVSVVAALLAPGAAWAAGPPDDLSGVDQYVEDIPTSEGPKKAGGDTTNPPPAPLTPAATESLAALGGDDASALEALATDPSLGAPTQALATRAAAGPGEDAGGVSLAAALSGGFGALTGADGRAGAGVLLLVLLLTTVIVVVAARRARHRV